MSEDTKVLNFNKKRQENIEQREETSKEFSFKTS